MATACLALSSWKSDFHLMKEDKITWKLFINCIPHGPGDLEILHACALTHVHAHPLLMGPSTLITVLRLTQRQKQSQLWAPRGSYTFPKYRGFLLHSHQETGICLRGACSLLREARQPFRSDPLTNSRWCSVSCAKACWGNEAESSDC